MNLSLQQTENSEVLFVSDDLAKLHNFHLPVVTFMHLFWLDGRGLTTYFTVADPLREWCGGWLTRKRK